MWTKKKAADSPQARELFARVRSKGWKSDSDRDELMKQVAAIPGLEASDVAWMAVDQDPQIRMGGLTVLKRWPFDTAAEALLPLLGQRTEGVRRNTMAALETLAGAFFPDKMIGYLDHPDPAVVHAALDFAKKNPSEKYLQGISRALTAASPSVRRKAFMILEATPSPRVAAIALEDARGRRRGSEIPLDTDSREAAGRGQHRAASQALQKRLRPGPGSRYPGAHPAARQRG